MKQPIISLLTVAFLLTACVQPSYEKNITITLTVKNRKGVQSVAIRGEGSPLSWYNDYPMQEVIKDSVYTASFKRVTGFRSTEMKFYINGEPELKDKPNRKIVYKDKKETIAINAVFDEE